jgi:hypothetical protein
MSDTRDAVREANNWRIVAAVKSGQLKPWVFMLCPDGKGGRRFEHLRDVPMNGWGCSCGFVHSYSSEDAEILFDAEPSRITELEATLARVTAERDELRTRAVMAEQHKVLSLLGRSSYAEVVEDKLRTQLAEEQIAREQAEAEAHALREALAQLKSELNDADMGAR